MERYPHNNPWADKLQQVSIPDAGEAWKAMEILLDKEKPPGGKKDRRRWILLILLLLLLIGVCNCPGRGRRIFSHGSVTTVPVLPSGPVAPVSDPAAVPTPARSPEAGVAGSHPASPLSAGPEEPPSPTGPTPPPNDASHPGVGSPATTGSRAPAIPFPSSSKPPSLPLSQPPSLSSSKPLLPSSSAGSHAVTSKTNPPALPSGAMTPSPYASHPSHTGHPRRKIHPSHKVQSPGAVQPPRTIQSPNTAPPHVGTSSPSGTVARTGDYTSAAPRPGARPAFADSLSREGDTAAPGPVSPADGKTYPAGSKTPPPDNGKKDNTGGPLVKSIAKDSSRKKTAPPPQEPEENERKGGWMIGIGLNQFFTVGGQQSSSYNSGGITGALGDYIPIPMIRHYFNDKLYVQLEAQLNAPQYTKKDLVISYIPNDSLSPSVKVTSSVAIKKLFYFNLPLSLHYNLFDRLDLGVGLQFSRLSNGIGLFNDNYMTTGQPDSLHIQTKSFKGDTLYQRIKTNEFRLLLDVNYTWKKFIIGLRYNQALDKFINLEVAPGQITQARNSSLQLYGRYILWDNRKKKTVPNPPSSSK